MDGPNTKEFILLLISRMLRGAGCPSPQSAIGLFPFIRQTGHASSVQLNQSFWESWCFISTPTIWTGLTACGGGGEIRISFLLVRSASRQSNQVAKPLQQGPTILALVNELKRCPPSCGNILKEIDVCTVSAPSAPAFQRHRRCRKCQHRGCMRLFWSEL
jgi:hypothetical protein